MIGNYYEYIGDKGWMAGVWQVIARVEVKHTPEAWVIRRLEEDMLMLSDLPADRWQLVRHPKRTDSSVCDERAQAEAAALKEKLRRRTQGGPEGL